MANPQRTNALHTKHDKLENLIEDEEKKSLPDAVAIHTLKKQKLKIKGRIAEYGFYMRSPVTSY